MPTKVKKALFLIPHPTFFSQLGGIGGHVSHVYGILNGLQENGYDVDIITGDGSEQLIGDGFNAVEPDKLSSNRLTFALSFLKKTKEIMGVNKYDFVYMRYVTLFSPFIPRLKKIIGPLPLVLEVNSFASQRYFSFRLIDRLAFNASDLIVAVSQMLVKDISEIIKNKDSGKVLLVINGVNTERFLCDANPIIPKVTGKVYIGYVGVLKPNYGLEELVDAALINQEKDDNNIETIIIGSGVIKDALIARAQGSKSIHFCDAIPYNKVPPVMTALDIVISTISPTNKCGLSTKIFEYMSCKRSIIVGKTVETEQLLEAGKDALFYTPGDSVDLAHVISSLGNNGDLRNSLASSAFDKVEKNHTWKRKVNVILEATNNSIHTY